MRTLESNGIQPAVLLPIAIVLGASIVVAGWFVGTGMKTARSYGRYVTVKGLAEFDVAADGAGNVPEQSQVNKTVRAVVTLEYYLED